VGGIGVGVGTVTTTVMIWMTGVWVGSGVCVLLGVVVGVGFGVGVCVVVREGRGVLDGAMVVELEENASQPPSRTRRTRYTPPVTARATRISTEKTRISFL
jgi:acetyltransferase-like isoleucine patch superfamily enzyme